MNCAFVKIQRGQNVLVVVCYPAACESYGVLASFVGSSTTFPSLAPYDVSEIHVVHLLKLAK